MGRYSRNMLTLSKAENDSLREKKVCVVGCGGLGGYIVEMLGRLGVGTITAIDGDTFDVTNLNRQILSDTTTLGKDKAKEAFNRMEKVNPEIKIIPIAEKLTKDNYPSLLRDCHVAVDALDNIKSRILLQESCEELNIPLVHGAIAGWYGQVTTIFPKDRSLNKIYSGYMDSEVDNPLGNPSYTPALIASIEVSEVVKILINRGNLLRNKMIFVNLLDNAFEIIDL